MRPVAEIIIHCSATAEQDFRAKDIDLWHRRRGWLMIGYHYVICRDGDVEPGRELGMSGAHAKGHNINSIGICMVGGVDGRGAPFNNFTNAQWASLHNLVGTIHSRYPEAKIIGHNEVSNKACPSFDVQQWLRDNPFLD